ncbi:MAG: hypothetical protein M3Q80_02855 [bacterium]|nr:hypothetical protein [bacterium]
MKSNVYLSTAILTIAGIVSLAGTASAQINANINTSVNLGSSSASSSSNTNVDGLPVQVDYNAQLNSQNGTGTSTVVTSTDDSVTVAYNIPAKFLGFFTVNMTEKATIQVVQGGETTVTVSRPWWVMFAKVQSKSKDVSNNIKSRIPSVSVTSKLDAYTRAQFVSAIQANAQAEAAASKDK